MLVLTRRPNESIIIADNIKITVVSVGPGRVKLGIEAPPNVRVDRQEIHDKIERAADVLHAVCAGNNSAHDTRTMAAIGPDTATMTAPPLAEAVAEVVAPSTPLSRLSSYRLPRKSR